MTVIWLRALAAAAMITPDGPRGARVPLPVDLVASAPLQAQVNLNTPLDLKRQLLHYKKTREWSPALSILWWSFEHRADWLEPTHVNIVITTLAAAQPIAEWERALMLLEQMAAAGMRPDAYSYSAAITACSRAGQPERAVAVFRQCCANEEAGYGPNRVVFNAMLSACQRGGPAWRAPLLAVFGSMAAHGVTPGAWAYSAAMDALAQVGSWERALAIIDELERPSSGVRPESHCYGAAMRACLRGGRWQSVLSLHERMAEVGVKRTAYTLAPALSACAAAPHELGWQRAHRIVTSEAPDGAMSGHCYAAAARAYAGGGRWREATALLESMRSAGLAPTAHVYTAVITAYGHSAQWQDALRALAQMRASHVPVDAHAVNAVLVVLGRAGRWREAAHLVRGMQAAFGVAPTAVHVSTTVQCLKGAGQCHAAVKLLEELMETQRVQPDAGLCDVALGICAELGAWKLALKLTAHLQADGRTLSPRMRRCTVVALCRGGRWREARRLMPPCRLPRKSSTSTNDHRSSQGAPYEKPSPSECTACYIALLHSMCMAGERHRAERLMRMLRHRGSPDMLDRAALEATWERLPDTVERRDEMA